MKLIIKANRLLYYASCALFGLYLDFAASYRDAAFVYLSFLFVFNAIVCFILDYYFNKAVDNGII